MYRTNRSLVIGRSSSVWRQWSFSAPSSSALSSRSAANRAAVPSSTPRTSMASQISRSANERTLNPVVASASSRPSLASRSSARRTGVRDALSSGTSASSVNRSPGLKSPRSSISRSLRTTRSVCVRASVGINTAIRGPGSGIRRTTELAEPDASATPLGGGCLGSRTPDRGPRLPPYFTCSLCHQLQLLPLIVGRQAISFVGRGEPALRAQGQPIERDDAGGGVDASANFVARFETRRFGTDQAEHHGSILRHVAQRLERTRTRIVVLEEKSIEASPREDLLGDAVVAARRVEHALVIAAADVNPEGDPVVAVDDRVVEIDARIEHLA